MTITTSAGGLYLVDVFLDDVLMTRMPFNITITRLESLTETAPKETAPKKKEAAPKKG